MSDTQKKRLLEHDQAAKGRSEKRRLIYLRNLPCIRHLGKPFRQASKQDIIKTMSDLEKSGLEEWTRHTYSVCRERKAVQPLDVEEKGRYPSR